MKFQQILREIKAIKVFYRMSNVEISGPNLK